MAAFGRARDGAIAMSVALSSVVLIGFAALAVDGGYVYWMQARLQAAADAAALAAVVELPGGDTLTTGQENTVKTTAQTWARKNMPTSEHGEVVPLANALPGHWDPDTRVFYTSDNLPADAEIDAVMVVAIRTGANANAAGLLFARILGFFDMDLTAAAVAWHGGGAENFCILALHPDLDGAIEMSGTNTLDFGECGIALHSTSDKALKMPGTTTITTGEVCVKHASLGVEQGGTITWTPDPPGDSVIQHEGASPPECEVPPDPLAGVAEPDTLGCDYFDPIAVITDTTLYPGKYCGELAISGTGITVTFEPGLYIIKEKFLISGNDNTITGDGVMFFLSNVEGSWSEFDVSGSNNTIDFTAATDDSNGEGTKGVLFFQARDAPDDTMKWKVAGANNTITMDGVIYMPNSLVEWSGDSIVPGPCGPKIIARRINWNGNSGFYSSDSSCASSGVTIGTPGGPLSLVS